MITFEISFETRDSADLHADAVAIKAAVAQALAAAGFVSELKVHGDQPAQGVEV